MSTEGWAIRRNNSCYTSVGEVFCQKTIYTFNACCPPSSFCPSSYAHNAYCCSEAGQNCSQTLIDTGPYCANSSWIPYVAADGGPFCCDPAEQGLGIGTADGCAPVGYVLQSGEQYLNPVRAVPKPGLSTTAAPAASSMTGMPQEQEQHSSIDTGAIVGGIVGGVGGIVIVAFLAWWLVRRHDKRAKQKRAEGPSVEEDKRSSGLSAVDTTGHIANAGGLPIEVGGTPKAELEGCSKMV